MLRFKLFSICCINVKSEIKKTPMFIHAHAAVQLYIAAYLAELALRCRYTVPSRNDAKIKQQGNKPLYNSFYQSVYIRFKSKVGRSIDRWLCV